MPVSLIRSGVVSAAAALALAFRASLAPALVNPNFTPLHLDKQSRIVCVVKVASMAADGASAELDVMESIRGAGGPKRYHVDFRAARGKPEGGEKADEAVAAWRQIGARPALLAIGGTAGKESAWLHAGVTWFRLATAADAGELVFVAADSGMNGTFNGSSDMLLATMRHIRDLPEVPVMRVTAGMEWTTHRSLAQGLSGATALVAVDANGDGRRDLHVLSPQGDRLLLNEAPDQWTACTGLVACSQAAVWGDFDNDGRPDLASLSTNGLTVFLQTAAGVFAPHAVKLPVPVARAYLTVDVVDLGDGKASLVVGAGRPVVLRNTDGKGAFAPLALPAAAADGVGPCVGGDLDGDGRPDVLWIREAGCTFWRGGSNGVFAAAADGGAGMGRARDRQVSIADFDGDGLPDVLLAGGGATPALLQNRGGGHFDETMRQTGEPGYIIQGGARCAAVGDFNADLFPDLFVGYDDENGQFFYNRGYRSFAIAETLKFKAEDIEGCDKGQRAACWIDTDGDGALELVTLQASGDVFLSRSSLGDADEARRILVKPPKAGGFAGSVNVTLRLNGHCLASRAVDRWGGPAVLPVPEAGRYSVEWATPDGRRHAKNIVVEKGLTEMTLE
jgi:hypothetical protein